MDTPPSQYTQSSTLPSTSVGPAAWAIGPQAYSSIPAARASLIRRSYLWAGAGVLLAAGIARALA